MENSQKKNRLTEKLRTFSVLIFIQIDEIKWHFISKIHKNGNTLYYFYRLKGGYNRWAVTQSWRRRLKVVLKLLFCCHLMKIYLAWFSVTYKNWSLFSGDEASCNIDHNNNQINKEVEETSCHEKRSDETEQQTSNCVCMVQDDPKNAIQRQKLEKPVLPLKVS